MSETNVAFGTVAEARAYLARLGGASDADLDLTEAALALALIDRPNADLDGCRAHLTELSDQVAAAAAARPDGLASRVAALNDVILGQQLYRGDTEDYDNLDNANLVSVIERRRGLPVTLGIIYIHAARTQGWPIDGLRFPGHFLVRLEAPDGRLLIDPFNGGITPDAVALRRLLQATAGEDATLRPDHYAVASDRAVLVRLQNNIKLRLLSADQFGPAVAVLETMLLFAPDEPDLWREAGALYAQLGNVPAGIHALEQFLLRSGDEQSRGRMANLLQRLRQQLN